MFCLIPIGMITFMVGGGLAAVIFPWNFIFVGLGFFSFMFFGFYSVYKGLQIPKFYSEIASKMSKKTNRELRLEPIYGTFFSGRRRGFTRNCTHMLVKRYNSNMSPTLYKQIGPVPINTAIQIAANVQLQNQTRNNI